MRLPRSTSANAAILSSIMFPNLIAALGNLDCKKIVTDGKEWDLGKLGGPRSVMNSLKTPPSFHNTTYTIDICQPLKRPGEVKKDDKCPGSTRVCAIERTIRPEDKFNEITEVIPLAGELENFDGGGPLNARVTRLSTSDSQKEGLRIVLNGGYYAKRKQKAVVEFLCDKDREGTETDLDPEDKYERSEEGEKKPIVDVSSLRFVKYERDLPDTQTDTLWLEWYTRYACEAQDGDGDADKKAQWGFFTWFLIIAFLVTAAYLIFGSWLNYNRYGARGWDLLPHGDTIRDIPYLLKDWTRRVLNTVQGSGSRGGYSAV